MFIIWNKCTWRSLLLLKWNSKINNKLSRQKGTLIYETRKIFARKITRTRFHSKSTWLQNEPDTLVSRPCCWFLTKYMHTRYTKFRTIPRPISAHFAISLILYWSDVTWNLDLIFHPVLVHFTHKFSKLHQSQRETKEWYLQKFKIGRLISNWIGLWICDLIDYITWSVKCKSMWMTVSEFAYERSWHQKLILFKKIEYEYVWLVFFSYRSEW